MNDLRYDAHDPHSPDDDTVVASRLGTALSERLQTEHPDLPRLSVHAVARGTRLRRRRQAALVLGGAAAVGLIGGASALLGATGPAVEEDPVSFAAAPTTAPAEPGASTAPGPLTAGPLTAGQVLDLGNGLQGTVIPAGEAEHLLGMNTDAGRGAGWALMVAGPLDVLEQWWAGGFGTLTSDLPGITIAVSATDAEALGLLGQLDEAPVTVGAGWTCEWHLPDDKASCTAADGGVAALVVRDAADRDEWLAQKDPATYTTEVHDGIFISVQGGLGTTDAELTELGESLTWVD
ncbi:hypothetical protein JK386_02950 [Nocardioides sp. zg-536]|uniref:Uncharacterized protein n=1 Tax=Nocardioides faecalis TaxID=2803858 RepID=A0A939BUG6_9ACTN|nr:hypothetical protein [Nocardioides faecalis]MBM9458846.1 hypothetical protein [Nocardioides faecalis]QVI60252.1 hypothetical protein KG111_08210 [Nocardioides faecalis]